MTKDEEKKMILAKANPPLSTDERKTKFLHLMYEIVGSETTKEVRQKVNTILGMYDEALTEAKIISSNGVLSNSFAELFKAIEKIEAGHYGSAKNFIERYINSQNR